MGVDAYLDLKRIRHGDGEVKIPHFVCQGPTVLIPLYPVEYGTPPWSVVNFEARSREFQEQLEYFDYRSPMRVLPLGGHLCVVPVALATAKHFFPPESSWSPGCVGWEEIEAYAAKLSEGLWCPEHYYVIGSCNDVSWSQHEWPLGVEVVDMLHLRLWT